ncbi:MAG: ferritin-like domain-containing protein [Polyangiales bacterium]
MLLDLREASRAAMPTVPRLPHLAIAARATWHGRMINEWCSARVFSALAEQLEDAGFSAEEVEACRGFASEERRHGVLCGAVVEALGGEACAEIGALPNVPRHDAVDRREAIVRNLLSVSCMSETVAVALIGAERHEMPSGALRDLLDGIWADEIGHARFGWRIVERVVPELDAAAHHRLAAYLRVAFAHVEEHELAHLPANGAPPEEGKQLGLCDGGDARTLFYDTLETVIVPRLEALGLSARLAWRNRHST